MILRELIEQIEKTSLLEIRARSEERLECVVETKRLALLGELLEHYFGPPIKRAGEKPSDQDKTLTGELGGILKNQTLYCVSDGGSSSLAMIWPWSDGERATVKIFKSGGNQSEAK